MRGRSRLRLARALIAAVILAAPVTERAVEEPRAPYVATPDALVDSMLELAETGPGDHLIDLGSGDGRIAVRAVTRFRARSALGIDIDAGLVRVGGENALAALVDFRRPLVKAAGIATQ